MAALLFSRGHKFTHFTDRLFYTKTGSTIMSAIFGIAFAFMFQKVCKGAQCYIFKSPPQEEISKYVYQIEDEGCFKYKPKVVPCGVE
jgi:hypothetical protein